MVFYIKNKGWRKIVILASVSISCIVMIGELHNEKDNKFNEMIQVSQKKERLSEQVKIELISKGLEANIAENKIKNYNWKYISPQLTKIERKFKINKNNLISEISKKVLQNESIDLRNYSAIVGLLQRVGKFNLTDSEKTTIMNINEIKEA